MLYPSNTTIRMEGNTVLPLTRETLEKMLNRKKAEF